MTKATFDHATVVTLLLSLLCMQKEHSQPAVFTGINCKNSVIFITDHKKIDIINKDFEQRDKKKCV